MPATGLVLNESFFKAEYDRATHLALSVVLAVLLLVLLAISAVGPARPGFLLLAGIIILGVILFDGLKLLLIRGVLSYEVKAAGLAAGLFTLLAAGLQLAVPVFNRTLQGEI